jgi:DNA-binding NarL/FixJ family response regulator
MIPNRTEPIRVLIVDDHVVVRRGLISMLESIEEVKLVGEAGDAQEALEQIPIVRPDVLLLDIRMPGMDGLRLLRYLSDKKPELKIIILTNYAEEQFLLNAFQAGAYGYLLKNVKRKDLVDALYAAHEGRRMLSPELLNSALKQLSELSQQQALDRLGLSEGEIDLLKLVAEGHTNRQIAEEMFWSETTVKRKLSDVFQKLNATDRAQAVAVAMRYGLL